MQTVSSVGIMDGQLGLPLMAWPNPAQGLLAFEAKLPAEGKWRLAVRDLFGRTLMEQRGEGATCRGQFDLQGIPAGGYLLELESEGRKGVLKFWKE